MKGWLYIYGIWIILVYSPSSLFQQNDEDRHELLLNDKKSIYSNARCNKSFEMIDIQSLAPILIYAAPRAGLG